MKAAQINEYGDPSVIIINDIDKPSPKSDQVLVEVHAASLNPFDTIVRKGGIEAVTKMLPITLGGDIAGVITELGERVRQFKVGDKVYGQAAAMAGNSGAFAEFAATVESQVAIAPSNLDFKEAASLPLVGSSAVQAITEHIDIKSGQKLFIHGGAGGIGTIAIQIAKSLGAYVATTANGVGIALVKQLGVDEVIDYKRQNFWEVLSDYDAVFDTVGGDDFNKSFKILKQGGIAVTMIGVPDESAAKERAITAIKQLSKANTERLNKLREYIESGKVKAQVSKVFSLDEIKEAFTARESGQTTGKIVIEIKN